MADVLADFGAARGMPKLDEVCTLIGLPGKMDVDGSRVVDMVAAGQLAAVRDYCETDVLNTYLLYLKYQHLSGMLATEALLAEEQHVREFCVKEGKKRGHLAAFLELWK
ncbi:MAG: hypothetical protein EBQ80_00320 [Proteobacteria bacterium]|nr:hypothetical protein [Pseudomonadota bacterium]